MKVKTFNDTETVAIVLTMVAPEARRDRVTLDSLIEHLRSELDGSEQWPDPDHDVKDWSPNAGYTVDGVEAPDLFGMQVMADTSEPPIGGQVLFKGMLLHHVKGSQWRPVNPNIESDPITWTLMRSIASLEGELIYIINPR